MNLRKIGTITVKKLRVAALTGGLVFAASAVASRAEAQLPPAGQMGQGSPQYATKKVYTKGSEFKLPIVMEPSVRASTAQVKLYAKTVNSDWVVQETAGPTAKEFVYRVPQDGEYWFTLVTIDNQGRQSPSNLNADSGNILRVVVDSRPPVLETNVTTEFGESVLTVNVIDTNPDPASVRARVVGEAGERYLAPMPGQPNKFRVSANDLSMPIRVSARDLSGNESTRDLPPSGGGMHAAGGLPPISTGAPPTIAPPPNPYGSQSAQNSMPTPPLQQPYQQPYPQPYQNPQVTTPTPQSGGIANTSYKMADGSERPSDRKFINTTHAQVEYRVDKVGPSGLGKVEVYMTRDRGNNWEKLADCPNKRSPVEVDLPGEGLYGLRMVLSNGNGIGGHAPRPGERPQFYIEVDATSPTVQILPYEIVAGANALDIRWSATDANLGAEPVSIYYRTRADANWQVMARNLKNDGVYRWTFPRDVSEQIFYKLEVVDLAGNMTKVETPTPIMLDQTQPEATLLDIVGVGGSRPQGQGIPSQGIPSGAGGPAMPPARPVSPPMMPASIMPPPIR